MFRHLYFRLKTLTFKTLVSWSFLAATFYLLFVPMSFVLRITKRKRFTFKSALDKRADTYWTDAQPSIIFEIVNTSPFKELRYYLRKSGRRWLFPVILVIMLAGKIFRKKSDLNYAQVSSFIYTIY